MKKRKVLILSNYCGAYTGNGRNIKAFLNCAYRKYSDKYEFILAAGGMQYQNPDYNRWPWIVHGVLPNDQRELGDWVNDPNKMRNAAYGDFAIEKIVNKFKPDIVIGSEDEWGNFFMKHKEFFKYIPVIFWITIDSRPILKEAIDTATKSKYYWTWSKFAEKTFHEEYKLTHVKTQYPCIETTKFYRLSDEKRFELREKQKINQNAFIVGFVFRNQLRKLINKLIEGYVLFKNQNPEIKNTFLYTHTSYSEGWNIPDLCKQYGVNQEEVLCTYICRATKQYFVMSFKGQDIDNPIANYPRSMITVDVANGVSEEKLNEIYNLFNLYMHPATSGSCEMPVVEAALTELIVATSPYSFGEDVIELNKGSIPIDFDYYTEIGTQFLKSNQKSESIAKIIKDVYYMNKDKKREMEKFSRQWAYENYNMEINTDKIIAELDKIPQHNWDFIPKPEDFKKPDAPVQQVEDTVTWIKHLYKSILNMDLDEKDEGFRSWIHRIQQGQPREEVEKFFRSVAHNKNQELEQKIKNTQNPIDFGDLLNKQDKKRILLIIPESVGDIFMSTSLFQSIRNRYPKPEWSFYIATKKEYFSILEGNEYIDNILEYIPQMDNILWLEGQNFHKGYFDIVYPIHFGTQRLLNYLHNQNDKLDLQLN